MGYPQNPWVNHHLPMNIYSHGPEFGGIPPFQTHPNQGKIRPQACDEIWKHVLVDVNQTPGKCHRICIIIYILYTQISYYPIGFVFAVFTKPPKLDPPFRSFMSMSWLLPRCCVLTATSIMTRKTAKESRSWHSLLLWSFTSPSYLAREYRAHQAPIAGVAGHSAIADFCWWPSQSGFH